MEIQEDTDRNSKKKTPFVYRSFFNFWLAVLLPGSIIITMGGQFFKSDPLWADFLKLPSTYARILIFQLILGIWLYYKEYKPKSAKFKEDA
ncbi:hypothetical protein LV84_01501 [Algoriphagus ratkowskyi]|uniref:Uncharacterized protein n=1 Tax=Algoriphagus ratkowskyi TaxID=57028 RepID=A0A2W7RSK4_9BACT|nr:hypothetical protein [Algoriphagus ratkowskyi]PZX58297.1 hypothetical protein LV84_01501 [Algoriphagus ratkowskyi]TXD77827.1 hypothetical protein ESW18_10710 [Algoriphagus ratkowskyi]